MPNPPKLRPVTAGDADDAALVHKACFEHDPWPAHGFLSLLESGAAGVIAHGADGKGLGLILWRCAIDEAEILTFAVLPSHRRAGIGQSLLQKAIETLQSQNIARFFLEVAKNNDAAISLYSKAAFSIAGDRSGYYASPEGTTDAFIMLKQLN